MTSFSSRKRISSNTKPSVTSCPPGIDSSTSFAPTIPEEIKASISLFHTLSSTAVQQAIDHVLNFLVDHNFVSDSYHKVGSIRVKGISESQFLSFQNDLRPHLQTVVSTTTDSDHGAVSSSSSSSVLVVDVERNAAMLFSALYSLLLHAMINRIKLSILAQDLKIMNMPLSVTTMLCQSIKISRQRLDQHRSSSSSSSSSDRATTPSSGSSSVTGVLTTVHVPMPYRRVYPMLERFRWRVDVTIANGSLAKVMQPSITMQMVLGDGKIVIFQVTPQQLNQLRYGVAKLLQDMRGMERHPIMRITEEVHRREHDDQNK